MKYEAKGRVIKKNGKREGELNRKEKNGKKQK